MKTNSGIVSLILLSGAVVVMSACGTSEEAAESGASQYPGWVTQPADHYSEMRYMMAVGGGENMQAARETALANLASMFKAEIESERNLYQENVTHEADGEYMEEFTETMINATRIQSAEELENTEILEIYYAEHEPQYYALAAIDREENVRMIRREMERNNDRIERAHEQFQNAGEIYHKLGHLYQSQNLIYANQELERQKQIISMMSTGQSDYYYEDKIAEYRDFLNSISFVVDNQSHEAIGERINAYLDERNLHISEAEGDMLIEITEEIEETDMNRDDAEFLQWYLHINVYSNPAAGEDRYHVDGITFEGRTGALSLSEAENRVRREMVNNIDSEFSNFVQNRLFQ